MKRKKNKGNIYSFDIPETPWPDILPEDWDIWHDMMGYILASEINKPVIIETTSWHGYKPKIG